MTTWFKQLAFAPCLALACLTNCARADEGMWLFSNPPTQQIKEKYNVELSEEMLEHIQKSCLKFANTGSASFVSSNGLIMTNHHVGLRTVAQLSSKDVNYVRDGFQANSYEEEIKCPGLKLICLQEIVDVTEQVEAAVKDAATAEQADSARVACIKKIEEEANAEKGLKCNVVTLYQGGLYHLYCYKEFSDIRLVFTPEDCIGFFGGDPDNFCYPRYNLDVTFFRAYENDKPYQPEHYLKWSEYGANEGEFVLVSGHPARTNRFNTVADLEFQRDVYYPYMMNKYRRREVLYQTFGDLNEENARRVKTDLFGIQNSRKNRGGILQGLQTPELMQKKIDEENELRKLAKEQNALDPTQPDPWDVIENVMNDWSNYYIAYDLFEGNEAFVSAHIKRARLVVRYLMETAKPEEERNVNYKDELLHERRLEINEPFRASGKDVEALRLGDSLAMLYELSMQVPGGRAIGKAEITDELLDRIYAGKGPKARAFEIVNGTQINKNEFCDTLLHGSLKELTESNDPAIQIALAIESVASDLRDYYTVNVAEPMRQAYARIAKARFQVYGVNQYPDATFTLRLTYGSISGYQEDDGTAVPFETYVGGAYDHAAEHKFVEPYNLAQSWLDAKEEGRAPLDAPLNFVTNNDIIGGNSGSPAVNANGEVVGLIFDGNIQSLALNFTFEDVQSRAVLVHSVGIKNVLRDVYKNQRVADELGK
ncbi:MAG: S46 family peptidase [Planctomycetia bacterium]|nr:S46 family peptidase [Planctomycetia bacterium]